ncbi:MAG: hypothetical protein LAN71_14275 [Acidobacteriia bacterium]|nr:hypothetical protein [Terriglobia bacterium]
MEGSGHDRAVGARVPVTTGKVEGSNPFGSTKFNPEHNIFAHGNFVCPDSAENTIGAVTLRGRLLARTQREFLDYLRMQGGRNKE